MGYDNTKPREERDFKEIYPDLDERKTLPIFFVHNDKARIEEYQRKLHKNQPLLGSLNLNTFTALTQESSEKRFDRQMLEYGFQNLNKRHKVVSHTYIRPFESNERDNIHAILEKKQKLVEYDMDEQDLLYLKHLNTQLKGGIELTSEIFEILLTVLENEWTKLEEQMNSLNEDFTLGTTTLDYQGIINDKEYGNDDGIIGGLADDQKCAICNDSDCDNSNAIVFCDGCNIAVHQECYGIAFIPEGHWLCRKCMINKHKQVDCIFCPSKTGAFKQLDNSLWSHVVCALWINELYFANPIYMEPIEGIDSIPKSRWKLTCYICKKRNIGACIQCSNKNCFLAYHVTCAKRATLYMHMAKGINGAVHNKLTLKSFCDKHTPSTHYLLQDDILMGIKKTRNFFRDLTLLNQKNDQLTRTQRLNNKLNSFKWKTELNTPIAPKLFRDILVNKVISFKLDEIKTDFNRGSKRTSLLRGLGNRVTLGKQEYFSQLEFVSNEICKYWCLKRELKNGAALIRKNDNLVDSIVYSTNNNEELLDEKIQFGNVLLHDMAHLIDLSYNVWSRQVLRKQLLVANDNLYRHENFAVSKLIEVALQEVSSIDTKRLLTNYKTLNITTIKHKNDSLQYSTYTDFLTDLKLVHDDIVLNHKSIAPIIKYSQKMMKIAQGIEFDNTLMQHVWFDALVEAKAQAKARAADAESEIKDMAEIDHSEPNSEVVTFPTRLDSDEETLTDLETLNTVEEYELSTFLK